MISIVPYQSQYASAFYSLNKQWIETFFVMEPEDYRTLENPETYIIDQGGFIFVALLDEKPVGVCALIKRENNEFELSKMAVFPAAQGLKIGLLLAQNIIEKARAIHVEKLFLISNSKLIPALTLYEKVGFRYIKKFKSVYSRGNVKMEMVL